MVEVGVVNFFFIGVVVYFLLSFKTSWRVVTFRYFIQLQLSEYRGAWAVKQ